MFPAGGTADTLRLERSAFNRHGSSNLSRGTKFFDKLYGSYTEGSAKWLAIRFEPGGM